MHILLVADGRSPITRRWINGLLALNHKVTLVSTYPCKNVNGTAGTYLLPVAFSGLGGNQIKPAANSRGDQIKANPLRRWIQKFRSLFLFARYWAGPLTLPGYGRQFQKIVDEARPDLVHALRIPFEGMLASYSPAEMPLAVSVWGNDLTLHGYGSSLMEKWSRTTLKRADGLAADAHRDIRLGRQWGFREQLPTLVVPGSGGIELANMNRLAVSQNNWISEILPAGVPLVINPRGYRPGSVRNDVFFKAIPLVLERFPRVFFLCTGMQGQPEAIEWLQKLKIEQHVKLLPFLRQAELWDLFWRADISVSVSSHDGTPNSLLEAMTCGCFPVAGDIESLREWITPGVNGLLVEPGKPEALAGALLTGLENPALRKIAADHNLQLIREKAEIGVVRAQIDWFYRQLAVKQPVKK